MAFAPAASAQRPGQTGETRGGSGDLPVIVNTDLVTLTVTVTDQLGRFVSGLSKSFTVFDEKEPQEITFFSDDDAPVSVGVVFDVSGSMSGDKLRMAREALSRFIQTSHNADEYFLIAFNSRGSVVARPVQSTLRSSCGSNTRLATGRLSSRVMASGAGSRCESNRRAGCRGYQCLRSKAIMPLRNRAKYRNTQISDSN